MKTFKEEIATQDKAEKHLWCYWNCCCAEYCHTHKKNCKKDLSWLKWIWIDKFKPMWIWKIEKLIKK